MNLTSLAELSTQHLNAPQLFSILTLLDLTGVEYIVLDGTAATVHGNLLRDDKDYSIYHKGSEPPHIVDRLTDFGYFTSDEPVFTDWYVTSTYHA